MFAAWSSPRIFLLIANKFFFRPLVPEADGPTILQSVVLSLPNTIEAIMGTTIVTAILAWAQRRFQPQFDRVPVAGVALLGTLIAGVYAFTQEFKLHMLGGRHVIKFKLAIRDDRSVPVVESERWCDFIDQRYIRVEARTRD